MGYGYPLFKWAPEIQINKTMENDEEENIIVGEEIPIQHEDNLVNMEIEEGDEANYYVNKEEIIEDDEKVIIYAYVNEEDESNEYKIK